MPFVINKIGKTCEMLKEQMSQEICKLENLEYQKTEYKKGHTPPKSNYMPYVPNTHIFGADTHYWFRFNFTTPKAQEPFYYVMEMTTGSEGEWDAINAQGLIYLNGEMVQGLDPNHIYTYLQPDTHYEAYNYFYLGMVEESVAIKGRLLKNDPRIEKLYYDIFVPYECALIMDKKSEEYITILSALEQTVNLIDLRVPYSEEYYNSLAEAQKYIEREFYAKKCTTKGKPVVNCIGHTHIDVEWLWTRAQTREKIQRSFSTIEQLMYRYPEYKFMLSQPELYRYLKEDAPDKYDVLKTFVKEGRWEPEGAMYVEADCNLISGESMVRQILRGKQFFKNEFGVDCKVLFLPDVFGYSAALPQILKKSGIDHFVTSKISWNDTNTMPCDAFMWQGIDGSEIFTNFITAQDYDPTGKANFTTYNGVLSPSEIKGARHRFQQKKYTERALVTFGHGDGGGGPTAKMLETQRRLAKGIPGMPVTEIKFIAPYLDSVRKDFDKTCTATKVTPKWVGELYLELHRGTYTSIGKNKRLNRQSETALKNAEGLGVIAETLGKAYPTDMLDISWRKVLHNQFHDIIPGSSINEVYDGTDKDYAKLLGDLNGDIQESLKTIASNINSKGGVLVFNPLSAKQSVLTKINGTTYESQETVDSLGWTVINPKAQKSGVKLGNLTAENKFYRMKLDNSGRIVSLYDKINGRSVLKKGEYGNELQVFEDIPRDYDAWEISDFHKQKMWKIDAPAKIEQITDGSRAGFKITHKYLDSVIEQKIWLYTECRRIDFQNNVDWHQKFQLLRVAFPIDVNTTTADYDIQFGYATRPTHSNTSWDEAKFEVYAHKWADVSDGDFGVALMNDCKYGHSTEGSTLKLTLIKCAKYPNPQADQGEHNFTYSIMSHSGSFKEGGVVLEAQRLNNPLIAIDVEKGNGSLPQSYSYISCDSENVIIDTVKKAENGKGIIVRMYDAYNRRRNVTVNLPEGAKEVYLTNLMEEKIKQLKITNGKVTVPVNNFEIVTLNIL